MKILIILFFVLFLSGAGNGQTVEAITVLDNSINESSGLIYLNQKLITHNDSGGEAVLYELDSISGNVLRSIVIANATNVDWEDLCYDDSYIYIGDFGNNSGNRTDLKIYRLPINEYIDTPNDTVVADTILFSYSDQTDYTPASYSTNFDAEALISFDDSLYIFTKNWIDNQTNIYPIPKTPGKYVAEMMGSINAQGLVTSADYNRASNMVLLTGYTLFSSFVIRISGFNSNNFSNGRIDRILLDVPNSYSYQIESISSINKNEFFLTGEKSEIGDPGLFRLAMNNIVSTNLISDAHFNIFPNPASERIFVDYKDLSLVEIYDLHGSLQKSSTSNEIHVSELSKGTYVVKIKNFRGEKSMISKLVLK